MTEFIIKWMVTVGIIGGVMALVVGFIGAVWQGIQDKRK
jgi:hypothetical protein